MGTLAHFFEEQGIAKGVEQGIVKEKKHIARLMLVKRTDPKFISEITNLSPEEIAKIQASTEEE